MCDGAPLRTARATCGLGALALVTRLSVVVWAAARFPPAGDGFYYDTLARRIASGEGYTWLWPDGAVTYAAHYPVGYPALVAGAYALFGAHTVVAMALNAAFGSLGVVAMHRLALRATDPARAALAALVMAIHPALLPYTAAVMTEGVTAALLVIAAALGAAARDGRHAWRWRAAAGAVMGLATLVRPQCLVFAPALGALSVQAGSIRARAAAAGVVTAVVLACCAPWTIRNCVRMDRCALVSVNGGWNLLIGVQSTTGSWEEMKTPQACVSIWKEADKDACFERAATSAIARTPLAWIAAMPAKLSVTFDYIGASPWYMHLSNPAAFAEKERKTHGAIETAVTRALLLLALCAAAIIDGPRQRMRRIVVFAGVVGALTVHAWMGYVAVAAAIGLLGFGFLAEAPLLWSYTAVVVAATALTHAVFFGAGRYGLVVLPFVSAFGIAASRGPRLALRRVPIPPDAMESPSSSRSTGSSSRAIAR